LFSRDDHVDEASNLDAASGIVNMPARLGDLRRAAMQRAGLRAITGDNVTTGSGGQSMGRWSWIAAILVAMVATGGTASAQSEFPTKPVHIFVPYAPAAASTCSHARSATSCPGNGASRSWWKTDRVRAV
jgi:hypothetical protein